MRLTNQSGLRRDHQLLSFDWESLGRFVRGRTLQAVAMHFTAMGESRHDSLGRNDHRKRSSGGKQ